MANQAMEEAAAALAMEIERLSIGVDDHPSKRLRSGKGKATQAGGRSTSQFETSDSEMMFSAEAFKAMIPPEGLTQEEVISTFGSHSYDCLRTFQKLMESICVVRNRRFYRNDQTDLPPMSTQDSRSRRQSFSMNTSVESENLTLHAYNVSLRRRLDKVERNVSKMQKDINDLQQMLSPSTAKLRVKIMIFKEYREDVIIGRGAEPISVSSDKTDVIIPIPQRSAKTLPEFWRAVTQNVPYSVSQMMEKAVGVPEARKLKLRVGGDAGMGEYVDIVMETGNSQKTYVEWYKQLDSSGGSDGVDIVVCIGGD